MNSQRSELPGSPVSPRAARRTLAERAIDSATQNDGMLFVVDGEAGAGKTFLLREFVQAATERPRWSADFVRADEIEHHEPYSFIERLLARSRVADEDFDLDAQRDPVAVGRECVRRLTAAGDSRHHLIVLDDAHWIDAESQRVLRYVIPRVTRRRVLVAVGVRTSSAAASFGDFLIEHASDTPADTVHHLHPLTPSEIAALAVERFGTGISLRSAERIAELTEGTFLGVDSVFSAMTEAEISQLHLAWEPPLRSRADDDVLLHGFAALAAPARHACEILAVAGHEMTRDSLLATADALGETTDLDDAVAAGIVIEGGDVGTIMPRHALLARAIVATVPEDRRRAIYRALATTTTGHRAMRHSVRGSDSWSAELHQRVNAYVETVVDKNALGSATEVLRDALDVADDSDARTDLVESLALLHIRAKTGYLAVDLLDEIESLPSSTLREFISLVLSAHRVGQTLPQERAMRLLTTPVATPDERVILAFFAFMAVLLTMRAPDRTKVPPLIAMARSHAEQSPEHPSALTDPRLDWMVSRDARVLVLDCYEMVQLQFAADIDAVRDALPSLIRRADDLPDQSLKADALVAIAGAELAVGDLESGRATAEKCVELLDRVDAPWAAGTARVIFADCLVLQGEFDAALRHLQLSEQIAYSALDVESRSAWIALRAIIAAITGTTHDAASFEQVRQRRAAWEAYAPDLALLADCEQARAAGDPAGVLRACSADWAKKLTNTRHGHLTYRVHALIDLERLDEAEASIRDLAEWRGTRWQEYWGTLDWLRARAAEARGDEPTARWHYEAAAANAPAPLPHGLALTDFGRFLLRTGHRDEGLDTLRQADRLLGGIGAEGYRARVRQLLEGDSGTGAPRDHRMLLPTLTERERQIVAHLEKGRSNSQIAESLVVSVTTVRSHVSNVLRKLRLSSRGEVARLLRDERPRPD